MRKLLLICCALFWSVVALANTCTLPSGTYATLASTAGHWTGTGCTGGGYVAGNGDTATLSNGVNLTIGSSETWIIGTSPASGGTTALQVPSVPGTANLTVNGTFIYRGPVFWGGTNFTVGAGGIIQHDSSLASSPSTSNYVFELPFGCGVTTCVITTNGTSGSHVTWNLAASSGVGGGIVSQFATSDSGGINMTYTDITSQGSSSTDAIRVPLHSANAQFVLSHVTCTSCGQIEVSEVADGVNMSITNSVLSSVTGSSTSYRALAFGNGATMGAKTTGTRLVSGNYIENGAVWEDCTTLGVGPNITYTNNVIYDSGTAQHSVGVFESINCNLASNEWQNNLLFSYDNSLSGFASGFPSGNFLNTYFLFGSNQTCSSGTPDNYHWWNVGIGKNSVIDTLIAEEDCSQAGGGGKVVLTQGGQGSSSWTVEIKNSITIPTTLHGTADMAMLYDDAGGACNGTSTFCALLNIHNNTIVASNQGDVCGIYGRESTGIAGVLVHGHNNIGYLNSAGAGCKAGSSVTPAAGALVDVDYNWWWNLTSGRLYDNGNSAYSTPSPPGTHDTANSSPQFVDGTRNFLKWCKTLNGSDATWFDCIAHFKAQTAGYTPNALITYVQAGFSPMNAATATASSTGSYVGAVQPTLIAPGRSRGVWVR